MFQKFKFLLPASPKKYKYNKLLVFLSFINCFDLSLKKVFIAHGRGQVTFSSYLWKKEWTIRRGYVPEK